MTAPLVPGVFDEDDELFDRVRRLEESLEELHAFVAGARADLAAASPPGVADKLDIGDLDRWVREVLLPAYSRYVPRTGGAQRWCATWWRHPEAILRLDAVRRAGEALVPAGGTGPSLWWRDHVDHHLSVLLGPDGPFAGCSPIKHAPVEPLPAEPRPEDDE